MAGPAVERKKARIVIDGSTDHVARQRAWSIDVTAGEVVRACAAVPSGPVNPETEAQRSGRARAPCAATA